jgi:LAO/AO transport system kinase
LFSIISFTQSVILVYKRFIKRTANVIENAGIDYIWSLINVNDSETLKYPLLLKNDSKDLFEKLLTGDSQALARSITLAESQKAEHELLAEAILEKSVPYSGKSVRIGITGVPGVGKSTFIEAFGQYLIKEKGKKVAVLAVDPSSTKSKGSILGDKTRMMELSANENAFIRPSPSSGSLGGVGTASREIIVLCEAAGYDVIIVETVGVGQSETEVKELVDFFMLLMLPGAGDELQGIKRGIVELADAIFINKADGDNILKAREAKAAYTSALHLFPPVDSGWNSRVELCSSIEASNIDGAWKVIEEYADLTKGNGFWTKNRSEQMSTWLNHAVEHRILKRYLGKSGFSDRFKNLESQVLNGEMSPRKASRIFVDQLTSS